MVSIRIREALLLFVGDIFFFLLALWTTLVVRYFQLPEYDIIIDHLIPFSMLFVVWILVYIASGLYGKHTVLFKSNLTNIILNAQIVNVLFAATFFFLVPFFGIAPKTNLFIYLFMSFGFIVLWRLVLFPLLSFQRKRSALLIGSGNEMHEVLNEINNNSGYRFGFKASIDLDEVGTSQLVDGVADAISNEGVSVIILDAKDERVIPALPTLYNFIFRDVQFIDVSYLYEELFDRVSLSFVRLHWLIDNVKLTSKPIYDFLKRTMDLVLALIASIVFIVTFPLIAVLIKADDKGPIFIRQQRVGKNGHLMSVRKYRTMSVSDEGAWAGESANRITRVGKWLRITSIDELPQILNVLRGEMSFIGPRSDIVGLAKRLGEEIPYYNLRYTIKPGITGWAQTNQRYAPGVISPQSIDESGVRLTYDLYYVKNRSLWLDINIALQTFKTLLGRIKTFRASK